MCSFSFFATVVSPIGSTTTAGGAHLIYISSGNGLSQNGLSQKQEREKDKGQATNAQTHIMDDMKME